MSRKLQVKSAVLMKKRKLRLIVAACGVVVLGLWIFGVFGGRTSDAARHRAWGRTGRIWSELRLINKRLPAGFVRVFRLSRLEQEYEDRWCAERDALVASEYFTNVALAINNQSGRTARCGALLRTPARRDQTDGGSHSQGSSGSR